MAVGVPDETDDTRRDPPLEVDHLDARVVLVDGEPWRDAEPDASTDQPLDGAVVVGAKDDVRRTPRRGEMRLDLIHRTTAVEADQGLKRDLLEGWCSPERRERRTGGDHEDVLVGEQFDRVVRTVGNRQ